MLKKNIKILNIKEFQDKVREEQSSFYSFINKCKIHFNEEIIDMVWDMGFYLNSPILSDEVYEQMTSKYEVVFNQLEMQKILDYYNSIYPARRESLAQALSLIIVYMFKFLIKYKKNGTEEINIAYRPLLNLYSLKYLMKEDENKTNIFIIILQIYIYQNIQENFLSDKLKVYSMSLYMKTKELRKWISLNNTDEKLYYNFVKTELEILWNYYYLKTINFHDYQDTLSRFKELFQILICYAKNNNIYDDLSSHIYSYERIKHEINMRYNRKDYIYRVFKNIINIPYYLTGYGERPSRLFFTYLFLLIGYSLLFYIAPFIEFRDSFGIISHINFFDCIYFSSTTMLTIGYGDIIPTNVTTKLIVMTQQILGFLTAGAFIALYLRKLFRY